MKISLAFCLHNVEPVIESIFRSWLDNLSGKHAVEVIAVFDDCTDKSAAVAARTMAEYGDTIRYLPLHTDNIWEIRCNNRALEQAQGDVIIFAQGDNWCYTPGWDDTLFAVMDKAEEFYHTPLGMVVGAIGLLAGVKFNADFSLNRIECDRPHKGENFALHGIDPSTYPLSVYRVDAINRPFAVNVDNLRDYKGLDETYCPMDWDDADLSLQLLSLGYTNLYIPFDVVNLCSKKETLTRAQMDANYIHGERIARERWGKFVAERESSFKMLMPLTEDADGRLSL